MAKPLHISDSLDGLEKYSEIRIPSNFKLDIYREKMKKVSDNARKSELEKDEEQEFVFLYRYFLLLNHARKFKEFTKEKYPLDYSTAQTNIEKYAALKEILSSRYQENNDKDRNTEKNDHNSKISKPSPIQEKTLKDLTNHKTAGKLNSQCISSEELYSLINKKKNNINNKDSYIVIDVRSALDFKESHLTSSNVINIPEEVIIPGMSAGALAKSLSNDVKDLWAKRGQVNKLIILDWNSYEKNLKKEAKLYHLRDAMAKWDPSTMYKSPPLILEGGYEDLLAKYPHITTNPKVIPPLPKDVSIPSLDSFDYPMQILEPEIVKKPPPPPSQIKKSEVNKLTVDRSTKPTSSEETEEKKPKISTPEENSEETLKYPESDDPIETPSASEEDSVPSLTSEKENVPPSEKENIPAHDKTPDPKQLLSELRKVKPEIPVRPQSTETIKGGDEDDLQKPKHEKITPEVRTIPEKKIGESIHRVPLKKEDGSSGGILKRSSSSPNITQMDDEGSLRIPSFSRSNKPVVYAERTDSTYGKTAAGLTGLKNFANNCYMNSILQCLSNTKPLVTELISINRSLAINYQSKTKGKVAQEVIAAFRSMWSGDIRVYSIKDLKNLLGGLKEIFKGTGHQDSNEFLIILLEYLHDDLNIPANVESRLDGAKEETGEKAWGEFRRKNCSIIQRLFYGQHRSTVTCSTCNHSSATFEQFFNLFVPIPSKDKVTLQDCIQLYMSGEKISGWKCPKCKDERNATKKFDISRLPPILVIALKRFTHEEDSWLQKKEDLVTYPLEGLDMETFTVKGSEQRYKRYNLYAMSTHTGTLRAGHYKAICKNYKTDKWYMFDDQSVEALPAHSVRNNPEVYILFYSAELSNC